MKTKRGEKKGEEGDTKKEQEEGSNVFLFISNKVLPYLEWARLKWLLFSGTGTGRNYLK